MTEPRVAYVARIKPGSEHQVREAHDRLSQTMLDTQGVRGLSAFLGSGYYVLLLESAAGDFQEQFARFTSDPQVRQFFNGLSEYLEAPLPIDVRPADRRHHSAQQAGGSSMTTAQLPLVGEVHRWAISA